MSASSTSAAPTSAPTPPGKWVYSFGDGTAEGRAEMRDLLGGKGANLAEMSHLGLPVPPGFTITTDVCNGYYAAGQKFPEGLKGQVDQALALLEQRVGARFGDPAQPLLVSVRSGARVSMPGMMDTVLNLGLNDQTVEGLRQASGDDRFAYDSYRRFIQMFGNVVLDINHHDFEDVLEHVKSEAGVYEDTELTADHWKTVIERYKDLVLRETGQAFPQEARRQLWGAIGAVFESWQNPRAVTYRDLNEIPESWGTAVTVQAMVFGNMGEDCATGVAFTRDPSTGENIFYGEYLINAQGEDVVAGIRTPQSITVAAKEKQGSTLPAMEEVLPDVFRQLSEVRDRLERHYRDMQDIEFTVQRGKLYMLQTRSGKRTAQAALRIAVEMASEGLISQNDAIRRIEPKSLDQLLHPSIDPKAERKIAAKGLPASPGAACGMIALTADEAERLAGEGKPVILVRTETSPEDIHGMHAARGILTARGGMTSHAAVVARGMGRPCVSGAGDVRIDAKAGTVQIGAQRVAAGDVITIDGGTGDVMVGEVPTVEPELTGDFATLMGWADKVRQLRVRTNAETLSDAAAARRFGAEGIGLCRTEHMFFNAERILTVREMILANDGEGRRAALGKIEPMQEQDFYELFQVMRGLPVTIRLLDPPLHEFLPRLDAEFEELAEVTGLSVAEIKARTHRLHESNPMLGHRGCRLGITYPEIYETQARAIFKAARRVIEETGEHVVPEIMIPLIATRRELDLLKVMIDRIASESGVYGPKYTPIVYQVGTMIELPSAALRAGEIAQSAQFFSFGTNDLTQTTLGLSRDDAGSFLPAYQRAGIFEQDPFATIDRQGVGELMRIAVAKGRATRPDLKLGICGEHGGDPASIRFCAEVGLDYVSCSPFRVPIARLAAAQAALAKPDLPQG